MGLFSSLSSVSLRSLGESTSSSRSSFLPGGSQPSSLRRKGGPETEEELVGLMNAMRGAFTDADAVGRQLIKGGEEALTPAQLKR